MEPVNIVVGALILIMGLSALMLAFRKKNKEVIYTGINENQLAKRISQYEGKKEQVNIAQIKEVLKVTLELLGGYKDEEIVKLINKHRK